MQSELTEFERLLDNLTSEIVPSLKRMRFTQYDASSIIESCLENMMNRNVSFHDVEFLEMTPTFWDKDNDNDESYNTFPRISKIFPNLKEIHLRIHHDLEGANSVVVDESFLEQYFSSLRLHLGESLIRLEIHIENFEITLGDLMRVLSVNGFTSKKAL